MVDTRAARVVVAAAIVTLVVARPQPSVEPSRHFAVVVRTEGMPQVETGAMVFSGDSISTGGATRIALRTRAGTSIRLDEHTRVRFSERRLIELEAGAIYLDTVDQEDPFEIRTSTGTVSRLGTQFEIRVLARLVRVRVRSGMATVARGPETITVVPGTELRLTSDGTESRAVPAFGDDWNWVTTLAPAFHIDGQRLSAFLSYLARENGWTLHYADAGVQRIASATVLKGSADGLEAEAALDVAMKSAALAHTLDRGELRIWRPSSR